MSAFQLRALREAFGAQIARKIAWAARVTPPALREDAMQEAALEVHLALGRYRESEGVKPATFCALRVRGAVMDFGRKEDPLTRRERQEVKRGEAVPIVFDDLCTGRRMASAEPNPERRALAIVRVERIRSILSRREWIAIEGFYVLGLTNGEIGAQLGCGEARASQIRERALSKIRKREV